MPLFATPVHIERSACAATPLPDIVGILRIELSKQLAEGPVQGDAYRVVVDCSGERVVIVVDVPARPSRTYETNLTGAPPNVRSRIVALAIAEIVRELDREPPPAPPPSPPPLPPPPVVVAPSPPPSPVEDHATQPLPPPRTQSDFELGAFAQGSTFRFDGAWLFGGGLRFEYAHAHVAAGIDAVFLTTREQFDLGSAQIALGYASPTLAWQERIGVLRTRIGAGYAVGYARLSGRASDTRAVAGSVSGAWSAPYAFAALTFPFTEALHLDARAQFGVVTLPVVGEVSGASDIDLKGTWASAQLGLSLAL